MCFFVLSEKPIFAELKTECKHYGHKLPKKKSGLENWSYSWYRCWLQAACNSIVGNTSVSSIMWAEQERARCM